MKQALAEQGRDKFAIPRSFPMQNHDKIKVETETGLTLDVVVTSFNVTPFGF